SNSGIAATAHVRSWHFSTDRGIAASRQQLGLNRTSQTLWFDAVDPQRTSASLKSCTAQVLTWWLPSGMLPKVSLKKREENVMTKLTRRQMLATAAVAAWAPMGYLPAHGAAPLIGKQVPSYYRYKVGSYEVTVVSDGARSWPLDIVRNATKEEVNTALAAAY